MSVTEPDRRRGELQDLLLEVIRNHQKHYFGMAQNGAALIVQEEVLDVLAAVASHYIVMDDTDELRRMKHASRFDNSVLHGIHLREKNLRKAA